MTVRRAASLLFLLLLAACEPSGQVIEAAPPPVEVESTTSTSTSTSTSTTTSTTVARVTTTAATVARVTATTRAAGACDPNYAGACVPIASDVDCAGGSGNGPAYVSAKRFQVVGNDIYGLDSDNDGIACET